MHSIQITDDADLQFLYQVDIGEQDFLQLKQEQSLNIEYQSFRGMLTALFEQCLQQAGREDRSQNAFIAHLDMTKGQDAVFSIVECSPLKNMCQIEIKLREANDEQIKRHLAVNLGTARKEIERLRDSETNLKDGLHLCQTEIEKVMTRLTS